MCGNGRSVIQREKSLPGSTDAGAGSTGALFTSTDAGTNFARWIAPWGADTQPWAVILNPFHRRWFHRRFVRITDAGTNFARWIAPWGADTQPWAVILNPFHRRWFHRRFVRITDAGTNFARWHCPLGRRYATLGSHSEPLPQVLVPQALCSHQRMQALISHGALPGPTDGALVPPAPCELQRMRVLVSPAAAAWRRRGRC